MVVGMSQLKPGDPDYKLFQDKFVHGWKHAGKTATIHAIYRANTRELLKSYRSKRFGKYMATYGEGFSTFFHGTQRACNVGESGRNLRYCQNKECYLCCILWNSFKVAQASGGGMFGPGIYTSPISSKADNYAHNHHIKSNLHAMLVCRVVCSRPQQMTQSQPVSEPAAGYNCVEGLTKANNGTLEWPEFVVYRDDAIVPVGVVMYTRS